MNVLFASPHNHMDQTSGAAISTRSTLRALARSGHSVRALTGSIFDDDSFCEEDLTRSLRRQTAERRINRFAAKLDGKSLEFRTIEFDDAGVLSTIFLADEAFAPTPSRIPPSERSAFYRYLAKELAANPPDVFTTYGGDPRILEAAKQAKKQGARTVFFLHNLAYRFPGHFAPFDAVVVPSEYAKAFYKRALGLETVVIPPIIEEESVVAKERDEKYITLVNPAVEKGRNVFLALAREFSQTLPEASFLLVDARSKVEDLARIPNALKTTNLRSIGNVSKPSLFLAETRILLVPSLCEESFGRVVVEGALNGIPVVASDRGALPEVVGDPRFALPIPKRFSVSVSGDLVPTREELAPWLGIVEKLWRDETFARETGEALHRRCEGRRQTVVERKWAEFFDNLARRADARRQ